MTGQAPLAEQLERARLAKPDRIGVGHWQEWVAYAVTLDAALDDVEAALAQAEELLKAWMTVTERGTDGVRTEEWYALRDATRLAVSPEKNQ